MKPTAWIQIIIMMQGERGKIIVLALNTTILIRLFDEKAKTK